MENRITETPVQLHRRGIKALREALGPIDMVRFLQQYDLGYGDYTTEREELLEHITIDDIVASIEAGRKSE